jgi:hypothetical protein
VSTLKSKPVSQMPKWELEEAIKRYKFVLMKLHKEMADKDIEIARLNRIIDQLQRKHHG